MTIPPAWIDVGAAAILERLTGGSSGLDDMAEAIAKDHAQAALAAVLPVIVRDMLTEISRGRRLHESWSTYRARAAIREWAKERGIEIESKP